MPSSGCQCETSTDPSDNFGVIPIYELIESSGVIAAKIDGLPDGTEVKITVVD